MRHGSLVEAEGYGGCNLTSPGKDPLASTTSKIPFFLIVWWSNYYSLLPGAYGTDVKSFKFRSEKLILFYWGKKEINQYTGNIGQKKLV